MKLTILVLIFQSIVALGNDSRLKVFKQDTMLNAYQTRIEMSIPRASDVKEICRQAEFEIEMTKMLIGVFKNCQRAIDLCEEQRVELKKRLQFDSYYIPSLRFDYTEKQKNELIQKVEALKKEHQISDVTINPINQDKISHVNYQFSDNSLSKRIENLLGTALMEDSYNLKMYNQTLEVYRKDIYCDLMQNKANLKVEVTVEDYRLNPWSGITSITAYDVYKDISSKTKIDVKKKRSKIMLMGARLADSFRNLEIKDLSEKDLVNVVRSVVDLSSLNWKNYHSFSQFEALNFPMKEQVETFPVNVSIGVRK